MAVPGGLNLKLVIDGSSTGAIRALTQVQQETAKTGGALSQMDVASGGFAKTNTGLASISSQLSQITRAVGGLAGIAVGVSGFAELQRLSDEYKSIDSRIKLASTSSADFAAAQRGIFEIAQRNGRELAATGTLYSRIAEPVRAMGKTSQDALTIVDAVSASLRIAGASASESASAQLQFSQALASANLQGDELRAILESAPPLAKALAAAMRVSVGDLKLMGAEGKLTSKAIADALLEQADALKARAGQMETTIGEAMTRVRNAFQLVFNEKTAGSSGRIAAGINVIATNMETLVNVATVAGAALLAVFGARTLAAIGAKIAANQALIASDVAVTQAAVVNAAANVRAAEAQAAQTLTTHALTAAKLELAAAERAAAVASAGVAARAGGGLLGLLGGPLGAIATALTLGITAWQIWGNKGEEAVAKTGKSLADLTKELKDFADTMPEKEKIKKYEELAAAIARAREEEAKARDAARQKALGDINVATKAQVEGAVDADPQVKKLNADRVAAEKLLQDELTELNKKATAERLFLVKSVVEKQKALNGELVQDEKKALEQRAADHAKAAAAVRDAWIKTMAEAKAKRDEATAAPEKTAQLADSLKGRTDAVRMAGMSEQEKQDFQAQQAIEAGQAAQDARTRASFELTKAYTQQLRGDVEKSKKSFDAAEKDLSKAFGLAEKAGDTGLMDEIAARLVDVSTARGQIAAKEADQLDQQAEAQRSKMLELDAQAEALKNKLAGMEVDVKIDKAVAQIAQLDAAAEALKTKLAGLNAGAAPQANQQVAADINTADLGGFAHGGPLPGHAPHDRADNMLYWGTPGEWVIQRPAARYYGAAFMAALNAMKLPKFALGGQIGGSAIDRLRVPTMPAAATQAAARNLTLVLDGQRYGVSADAGVIGRLTDHVAREALRKGGRR